MKKILALFTAIVFFGLVHAQYDTIGKNPFLYNYNWPETGVLHDGSGYCSIYIGQAGAAAHSGDDQSWWINYINSLGGRECEYALYQHTDTPITAIGLAIGYQSYGYNLTKKVSLYDSTMEELASVRGTFDTYYWDFVYVDTNAHHFFFPGLEPIAPGVDPTNFAFTYLYYEFFGKEVVLDGTYYIGFYPETSTCMGHLPAYMYETHGEPYHFANPFRVRVDSIWSPIRTSRFVPVLFAILKLPCEPVDSVTVVVGTDGCLTADWERPELQSSWTVSLSMPDGSEIVQPTDTNHWEYCGLAPGQHYTVRVRSRCDDINGHSWSDWSDGFSYGNSSNGINPTLTVPDFTLTPNPASGTVTIGGIEGEATIEIIDMAGRKIAEHSTLSTAHSLDISRLPAGSYVVRITMPKGTASRMLQVE